MGFGQNTGSALSSGSSLETNYGLNRRRRLAGAYGIMLLPAAVPVQASGDLAWGLNFLWVLVAALTIKAVVSALKKKDVIKRCYTKNHLMGRISGTMFDATIAVGIMAIALRM